MPANIPSEQEVLGYFDSLSNWGRWGKDDELGTLNFLSQAKVMQAVGLVEDGTTVSCARTVTFEPEADIPRPPLHYMIESGEGWASGDKGEQPHHSGVHRLLWNGVSRLRHHPR
jgi:hypothetical protein